MNKKIMVLLVAAALTTGMGGFGTYAYFNDGKDLTNKVSITMGKLEVVPYWATDAGQNTWKATSTVKEVKATDGGETLSFENVKPGDTFERKISIVNYGTLNADTLVTIKSDIAKELGIKLEGDVISQSGKAKLQSDGRIFEKAMIPGGWISLTVKVTVPTNAGSEWENKVINLDASKFINVYSQQTME